MLESFCNRKQLPFGKDTFLTILPGTFFTDVMAAASLPPNPSALHPSVFLSLFPWTCLFSTRLVSSFQAIRSYWPEAPFALN